MIQRSGVSKDGARTCLPCSVVDAGSQIDVPLLVVDFIDRLIVFIAKAEVESQVRGNLPVVLDEGGVAVLTLA
jgi:hypothetical protein